MQQLASPIESPPPGTTFDRPADPATVRACLELYKAFRDPLQFIPSALKVQNRQGKLVPFKLKKKQIELCERVEARRADGRPIRFIIPKTRRVGISANIAGLIFHQTPFFEGQSALILAHEKSAARNLFNYYHRFEQNYAPFKGIGLPRVLSRTASQDAGSIRWANRSQIEIATAKNLDFSRSFDFRFLHLSEYAYYRSIRGLMTALIATVADDPATMIFKESTAQGYNEFYADCIAAQEGTSDYELFFVGCFDDEENWRELERDHVDPLKFEASLTDDEWALQERYSLVLEQLYWRRMKLKDYSGDLKRFDQEFPHSFDVAFQSSGRQRFDPSLFLWMPTEVPSKRGELRKEERNRKETYYFAPHQFGELTIWKDFARGGQYVGGVDPAKGVDINEGVGTPDPDWCAVEIGERGTGEQVMELHTRVPPVTLAQYLYDLGAWCNQQTGRWIFWVGEVGFDGGNGLAVLTELVRLGYPLEYIYFDEVLDEATAKRKKQIGFVIRPNTRPLLISNHERTLIEHGLMLHSKSAIAEHRTFVYKKRASGGVKIEHEDGCFTANTQILLSNGRQVSIANCSEADRILSHKGLDSAIIRTMQRQYSGPLFSIKAAGVPGPIEATAEHPFWAKAIRARRSHCRVGPAFRTINKWLTEGRIPTEWIEAKDLRRGDFVAIPKRANLEPTELSNEQLYAVGFWLAEGHFHQAAGKGVGHRDGSNGHDGLGATNTERQTVERIGTTLQQWFPTHQTSIGNGRMKTRLREPIPSHFRVDRRKRSAETKLIHTLSFYSRFAAEWFAQFGKSAKDKHISDAVFNRSGLLALVAGFADGDGTQRVSQQQDVTLFTISEHLAWQLRQILLDNGIWCTISVGQPRVGRNGNHRHPCWKVNIKTHYLAPLARLSSRLRDVENGKTFARVLEDETHFYTRVVSVTKRQYNGTVYNCEASGDHSYVAGGIGAHNCHDDLVFGCMYLSWAMEKAPAPPQPERKNVRQIHKRGQPRKRQDPGEEEFWRRQRQRR